MSRRATAADMSQRLTRAQRKRAARLHNRLGINSRRGRRLARIIDDNGGRGYGALCVHAGRRTPLTIAQVAALIDKETDFHHIYGRDPVRNPIKSPLNGQLPVTRRNYRVYRRLRKLGLGMQGVGLTQPTWWEYQDRADRAGGCWREIPNVLTGAQILADKIANRHGNVQLGAQDYNGTGPAARQYGHDYVDLAAAWERRLR